MHHDEDFQIYTDGAVTKEGKASAVIYIQNIRKEMAYRLSDNTEILTAELLAINLAIKWLILFQKEYFRTKRWLILSDNKNALDVINDIYQTQQNKVIIAIINNVRDIKEINIQFKWIPGHKGLEGNEIGNLVPSQQGTRETKYLDNRSMYY